MHRAHACSWAWAPIPIGARSGSSYSVAPPGSASGQRLGSSSLLSMASAGSDTAREEGGASY